MYQRDFGPINALLDALHLPDFPGLSSPSTVLISLLVVLLWKNMGLYTVIFLTNIQYISPTLYEAADLDGASYVQKVVKITWPYVRPALIVTLIYSVINYLKVFTIAKIMTNGGPNNASNFLAYYAYGKFSIGQYGEATAAATMLFLVVLIISSQLARIRNTI